MFVGRNLNFGVHKNSSLIEVAFKFLLLTKLKGTAKSKVNDFVKSSLGERNWLKTKPEGRMPEIRGLNWEGRGMRSGAQTKDLFNI